MNLTHEERIENVDGGILDKLAQLRLNLVQSAISGYYQLAEHDRRDAVNLKERSDFDQQFSDKFVNKYREGFKVNGVEISEKELGLVRELVMVLIGCGKLQLDFHQKYPALAMKDPQLIKAGVEALVFKQLYSVLNKYDKPFQRSPLSRVFFPPTSKVVGGLPGDSIGRAFTKVLEYGDEARKTNETHKTLSEVRL